MTWLSKRYKNVTPELLSKLRRQGNIRQKRRYATWKKELLEKFGGKCVECGSTDALQFHHKIPINQVQRGHQGKRYADIEKNPQLYALLCVSCHLSLHSDKHPLYHYGGGKK